MPQNPQPLDDLIASAELGTQARNFIEGELGKVLLGLAIQETQAAQEDLAVVEPTDVEKIRALQNKARFGQMFEQWLIDLVADGDNAISVFKQQKEG